MNLSRSTLLALGFAMLCTSGAAAQDDKWDKKYDLKPLLPSVVPLPPSSRLDSGTVGGTQTPYTSAPLQNPGASSPPAPGLKLSIPAR
ncbi:MAG TPA: hypothetical protein VGI22_21070 [Xanthobacteraceae bacterium]|jgi:hypothetical protein